MDKKRKLQVFLLLMEVSFSCNCLLCCAHHGTSLPCSCCTDAYAWCCVFFSSGLAAGWVLCLRSDETWSPRLPALCPLRSHKVHDCLSQGRRCVFAGITSSEKNSLCALLLAFCQFVVLFSDCLYLLAYKTTKVFWWKMLPYTCWDRRNQGKVCTLLMMILSLLLLLFCSLAAHGAAVNQDEIEDGKKYVSRHLNKRLLTQANAESRPVTRRRRRNRVQRQRRKEQEQTGARNS